MMAETRPKIRLFVEEALFPGAVVGLGPEQAHYLKHVMRAKSGDEIALFNGSDGEWRCRVDSLARGWGSIAVDTQNKPQRKDMDLWLLFAPVKRSGTDMIVQKATELGVSRLQPVMTRRTIAERIKLDRMAIIAREAAEQSGRVSVPEFAEPRDLARLLKEWPAERRLLFCDERGDGPTVARARVGVNTLVPGPWAILIGPEGGFEDVERALLANVSGATTISLGPEFCAVRPPPWLRSPSGKD